MRMMIVIVIIIMIIIMLIVIIIIHHYFREYETLIFPPLKIFCSSSTLTSSYHPIIKY